MFFRRPKPHVLTFAERMESLRAAGFSVARDGERARASRGECAADLPGGRAGVLMGAEIAQLVDDGFQKFFRTPSGRVKPALAGELEALHAFEEDLREALGVEGRYNLSLGTVSTYSEYDRRA